jgi:hypothetical protein
MKPMCVLEHEKKLGKPGVVVVVMDAHIIIPADIQSTSFPCRVAPYYINCYVLLGNCVPLKAYAMSNNPMIMHFCYLREC